MSYDATEDVMYGDVTVANGMNFLWITNTSGYFSWLNGIADDITLEEKQIIYVPVLTTTQNIGVQVEMKRAGAGYGLFYTQIASNTPMRFVEKDANARNIIITHPSSTALGMFLADSTGGDNFSNFSATSGSYVDEGANRIYTIPVPANKRLLICYKYS